MNLQFNRRNFISAASGTVLLGACESTHSERRLAPSNNVVLIHGAWHGGWCWQYVASILRDKGFNVLTPTLSGLGDRSAELSTAITLDTHIEDACAAIESSGLERFILVGHSYGGMVVTGVADRMKSRIEHVVYLDAAVPTDGQSMITVGPSKTEDEIAAIRQGLLALSQDDGLSMQPLPPEAFGIPGDHPKRDWVAENLTPHPFRTWTTPIALENGGASGLKKTYAHCTSPVLTPSSFPYFANQARNHPEWRLREIATGHDAMVTAPTEVADIIMSATVA